MGKEVEINLTGELSPEVKKYIDDRIDEFYSQLNQIKTSECIITTGEQHEIIYYIRCILSKKDVDLNKIPKWLAGLEVIKRNYFISEKLLTEWVSLTHFSSVSEYPNDLRKRTEDFINKSHLRSL